MSISQNTSGDNQQQGNKPQPAQQDQSRPQQGNSNPADGQKKSSEQEQAQQ